MPVQTSFKDLIHSSKGVDQNPSISLEFEVLQIHKGGSRLKSDKSSYLTQSLNLNHPFKLVSDSREFSFGISASYLSFKSLLKVRELANRVTSPHKVEEEKKFEESKSFLES